MFYYAMLNGKDVVTSVYAMLSPLPESKYIVEIGKAWYEDKRLIGMKYDRASHSFMFWACSTDNVRYLNTTQSLSDKLAEIDTELSAEGGNVAILVAEVADVKSTAERADTAVDRLDTQLASLSNQVGGVEDSVGSVIDEITSLTERQGRTDNSINTIWADIRIKEAEMSDFKTETAENFLDVQKDINNLDGRVSANAGEISRIDQNVEAVIHTVNDHESVINNLDAQVDLLTEATNDNTSAIANLVGNVNSIAADVENVEKAVESLPNEYIRKSLQFTADNGACQREYSADSDVNFLDEIASYPLGLTTIYTRVNAPGNPKTREAWRMLVHKTGNSVWWILAFGSVGSIYTNYYDSTNGYRGWKCIFDATPSALWSGKLIPKASDTIVPSKKLSECRSGWILMWSDYDASTDKANEYDYCTSVIYKCKPDGNSWSGQPFSFTLPSYAPLAESGDVRVMKKLRIYNDKIVGYDENETGLRNDVVLRAVMEF